MFFLWGGVGCVIIGLMVFSKGINPYKHIIKQALGGGDDAMPDMVSDDEKEKMAVKSQPNTFRVKFKNFFIGMGATAFFRSSSACTLVVVGMITGGAMTLNQAAAVIVGANLGVAFTNLLHSVAIFDVRIPLMGLCFVGGFMMFFAKKDKFRNLANIFAGFGLFFVGFQIMGGAFNDNPAFTELIAGFIEIVDFPPVLFLLGIVLVLIIQSSGAATALFLMLAVAGAITFTQVIFLVLGAFIGTTGTMFLVALPAGRDPLRAAMFHIYFNVFSSLLFFFVFWAFGDYLVPLLYQLVPSPIWQVTIFGLIRKFVSVVLVFPFIDPLTNLVRWTIKDDWNERWGIVKPTAVI
jgi:phosphate:Na+ symporter